MKKGLNIEVSNLQYQYLYDLVMFAYEMNLPNEKGWDLQTYDNLPTLHHKDFRVGFRFVNLTF